MLRDITETFCKRFVVETIRQHNNGGTGASLAGTLYTFHHSASQQATDHEEY